MKKEKLYLVLLLFAILSGPVFLHAQIQHGGIPLIKQTAILKTHAEGFQKTITLSNEQKTLKQQILTRETPSGQAMTAGFSIPLDIDPLRHGVWQNLGDSLWVWRFRLDVEQAHALGLVLRNFYLAEDARMFIYNENADYYIGAFTHKNNNHKQNFSSQIIPGSTIIIEYQEKIEKGRERFTSSFFNLTEAIYVVNGLADATGKDLGSSDECMININCSEGDNWQIQKRGVARMLMRSGNSWYWCTGSLINTTLHDGTPYFLTAHHCADDASAEDMDLWQFYFNFERPGCNNLGMPQNNVLFGAELIANGPLDGGSDFKLLLLYQPPPIAWRPYYNGWNNLNLPSESGVGIHHPAGDSKKISTYFGNVVSGGGSFNSGEVMADNAAWRFSFIGTENGHSVTQGGSSGSPMFNQDGLIVGTLSGGSSSCSNPNGVNIYGKMAYHWTSNHDHPAHRLAPHLDPLGTGLFFVNGYDPYIENHPAPGFVAARLTDNDTKAEITWLKPGHAPNKPGWYGYTNAFVGQNNDTPERATVFDAPALGFSYPVTISKISHVFRETANDPWQNDQFTFNIYGSDGMELLYTSPSLTAVSLEEVIHELDPPLIFDDKFYISVRPTHTSGHPASAYNITNQGNSYSYTGHSSEWEPVGNNTHEFVFLTKFYAEQGSEYPQEEGNEKALQADNSNEPFTVPNKWADLPLSYKIYKNNEEIDVLENENGIDLQYTDNLADETGEFVKYYIRAVYEGRQSPPSNSAYVFLNETCQDQVTGFPYTQIFETDELPPCWRNEGTAGNGWEFSQGYTASDETEVLPLEGDFFMVVEPMNEDQDEWLLTPSFNISQLEVPALRFHFTGNFTAANTDEDCQLQVYTSFAENTFVKAWDSSDSPLFRDNTNNTWIPVVLDLTHLTEDGNIRIGFQYTGNGGEKFAIDKIEIYDAAESVYDLSLGVLPFDMGEVYGAGSYIAGERVDIMAYANTAYFFESWTAGGNMLTWLPEYSFVMPENDYFIMANFTLENVTSSEDINLAEGITVYPNPGRGNYSLTSSAYMQNVTVEVYNMAGMLVKSQSLAQLQPGEVLNVDITGETEGLYIFMVQSDEGRIVKKVSVVR
ncbi:MAG: InlB B-repeat-containing protein [Bacteroidota bacterium]